MPSYKNELAEGVSGIRNLRDKIAEHIRNMPRPSGNQAFQDVVVFYGSDPGYVFNNLEHIVFPACVIWYQGSSYGNRPRRTTRFSLIILCDSTGNWETSDMEASAYVDDVYDHFHRKQLGEYAIAYLRKDNAINLAEQGACGYEIEIELEDL